MRFRSFALAAILIGGTFLLAPPHAAQAFSLVPTECQGTATISECGIPEIVGLFVRIGQYIFGISGAAALAMFVLGGFYWITSAGNTEQVQKGKSIITGAVIGLVIIFGAATAMRFLVQSVRTGTPGGVADTSFYEGEDCDSSGEAGISIQLEEGRQCVPYNASSCSGGDYVLKPLGFARTDMSTIDPAGYECLRGMFPEEAGISCCRRTSQDTEESSATTPAATTPPAATTNPSATAPGATGNCSCGLSASGRLALGMASEADITAAGAQCTSWGAAFNRADMSCTGTSTETECTRRNESSGLITCDWVAR